MAPATDAAQTILATERAAFERWAAGDVTGFLEISDPEVTYFDPFLDKRLDGLDGLRALYTPLQGTFKVDHWEMVDPKVAVAGDMAVLTFNFTGSATGKTVCWNTTEVYRRTNGEWKIIHTHWAYTKPEPAQPAG